MSFPINFYKVSGSSMLPEFKSGDLVVILRSKKLNTTDVVVAEVKGKKILKRITKKVNNHFWLEGDHGGASTDSRSFGWVSKSQIIGKVVFKL
ncbi:S26 family signal peptidase [Candidatus Daviesbacteria bacterium]|nr:S26 family signal peptidase [Candidatus Daviesbacteria bacterium]